MSLRSKILSASWPVRRFDCPHMEEPVYIRLLSINDRDRLSEALRSIPGDASAEIVVACLANADGSRVFTDDDLSEVRESVPSVVLEAVALEAVAVNFPRVDMGATAGKSKATQGEPSNSV